MIESHQVVVAIALAGAAVTARAQPTAEVPSATLRCYLDATGPGNLPELAAKQLCLGAASVAPARCVAQASADGFTTQDALRLCARATDLGPVGCERHLRATTTLSRHRAAAFCGAAHVALGPPSGPGAPACLDEARAQAVITAGQAARLCRGARSDAPVACFRYGRDRTTVDPDQLVDLCAPVVPAR